VGTTSKPGAVSAPLTLTIKGAAPPAPLPNAVQCATPVARRPSPDMVFGHVVDVPDDGDGRYWAVVEFDPSISCDNGYFLHGDMRRAPREGSTEQFRGIVNEVWDLGDCRKNGNHCLKIENQCPYRWPPAVGEPEMIYWKNAAENHC
jgi:hypothetical protein